MNLQTGACLPAVLLDKISMEACALWREICIVDQAIILEPTMPSHGGSTLSHLQQSLGTPRMPTVQSSLHEIAIKDEDSPPCQ